MSRLQFTRLSHCMFTKNFRGKSCESNETKNQLQYNVLYKGRIGENIFCQNRKQFEVFTAKSLVFRSTAIHRVSYLIAVSQEVLQSTPKILQPSILDS